MMKILLLISIISFLTLDQYSQVDDNLTYQDQALIWEISRDDVSFKSYLFGTHHFFSKEFIDTSAVIHSILSDVTGLTLEISDETIDSALLFGAMKMKDDEYYAFSSIEDESNFKKYLDTNNTLPGFSELYFTLKPMAIWLLIYYKEIADRSGKRSPNFVSIEMYLKNIFLENKKELTGLETMMDQVSLFMDSIPIKTQLEILMQLINTDKKAKILSNSMLDSCYKKQRIDCLSNVKMFGKNFPEQNDMFLDNRNKKWIPYILELIANKPVLIAVGAAHLTGENGLINLLRKLGYSMRPVRF